MAENDIYDSKGTYERIRDYLELYVLPPASVNGKKGLRRYYIRNKERTYMITAHKYAKV
jgi:hypothetical protein